MRNKPLSDCDLKVSTSKLFKNTGTISDHGNAIAANPS